jgi:hypothetical protein
MIKQVKLKKTKKTKKLKKNGKFKYIKNHINKHNKHNNNLTRKLLKNISKKLFRKSLRKSQINKKSKKLLRTQDGGNTKEKFEVKKLTDIDYSQFTLSKYVNTDIDWGSCPGPPPAPDCCIM